MFPMTPDERYMRDVAFRTLVDTLEAQISQAHYTPTEIREAAMLAAVHYEMRRPWRYVVIPTREFERKP